LLNRQTDDDLVGYTGKKHKNYIWIPKPKSDLKEYRDILRLCRILEDQEGYFNDRTLGIAQVEKGAIFDGSLDAKAYIKKYKDKTVGNQSYISNARMSLRMSRFFGWITRIANDEAKYKLTSRGRLLSSFRGKFPGQLAHYDEFEIMTSDILGFRFYCVNDQPNYQNKAFKQRVMFNILKFLKDYKYLHNYEIVITALTLKREEPNDYDTAYKRINSLRKKGETISSVLAQCDIDPWDHSSLTGVYDGPKVLCSFLKQLGLVLPVETSSLGAGAINYYKRVYRGSLIRNVPRNVFLITPKGEKLVDEYSNTIPLWYDDLPSPKENYAVALALFQKGSLDNKTLDALGLSEKFGAFLTERGLYADNKERIDFKLYRDVPPENEDNVSKLVAKLGIQSEGSDIDMKDLVFVPKAKKADALCIKCHPPRCYIYKDFREIPNSFDSLAYKLCPNDSLSRDGNSGDIIVKADQCVSCLLCVLSCPFGSIELQNGKIKVNRIPDRNNRSYDVREAQLDELEAITDSIIAAQSQKQRLVIDRVSIVNMFEDLISPTKQNWSQDEFYVWVRNCFRAMGLRTLYTGGKGMKTRSDVTIIDPFIAAIEVKSPSEGKVAAKAIRQTDDAAVQLFQKFRKRVYMCAIGQQISPEAIRKADEHREYRKSQGTPNYCIPLIPSKSLLYLTLVDIELSLAPAEIEQIFTSYHGEFDENALIDYLSSIDKRKPIPNIKKYIAEIGQIFK